jgi:hypothetical protein
MMLVLHAKKVQQRTLRCRRPTLPTHSSRHSSIPAPGNDEVSCHGDAGVAHVVHRLARPSSEATRDPAIISGKMVTLTGAGTVVLSASQEELCDGDGQRQGHRRPR